MASYSVQPAVLGAPIARDLGARVASAFRWAASAKLLGQLATWAMTLVAIRVVAPEHYGLMASGAVVIGFPMLVGELGLGAALVQRRTRDEGAEATAFGTVLGINAGLFCAVMLAAPMVAGIAREPRLSPILRVLALQFLVSAFEILPLARLERDLEFRRKSLVYLVASVSGGAATLGLALAGLGVWALVGGGLWLALARAIGVNVVSPVRCRPRLRVAELAGLLRFGGTVTAERALWFFYTQADVLIVGMLLGPLALGYYAVAMHLASLPMHKTGELVSELLFPTFARVQGDRARAAAYLVRAVRLMSVLAFPVFFGIASVAGDVVAVLLGARWEPAAPLLALLALVMPLRMLSNLFPPALQGLGRPGVSVGSLVVAALVMPAAFVAGAGGGVVGLAVGWLVAFPAVFAIVASRACAVLGVPVRVLLAAMAAPAAASAVMAGIVLAGRWLLADAASGPARLAASVALGALCYGAIIFFRYRAGWREVLDLARR